MSLVSKEAARAIFGEALERIAVEPALERKLRREGERLWVEEEPVDLGRFRRVVVIAFGKAADTMARGVARHVRDRFFAGVIVTGAPVAAPLGDYRYFVGGHPYPNEQSLAAAEAILTLLSAADENTLILFLISGGGSALVEKPIEPIALEELVETYRVLVTSGAKIEEINVIRKHLSAVKGGRLALAAGAATVVTLLISDVPEGKLSTIASGPTLPDESTAAECYRIAQLRGLDEKFPLRVRELFLNQKLAETPKAGDPAFARSHAFVLLSSRDAAEAAVAAAEGRGFATVVDNSVDDLPPGKAADHLLRRLSELRGQNPGQPVCLISAGELECPVTGTGLGGRNQVFVLDCVERIAGEHVVVLSAGTDGIDGNSPAAGAVADRDTFGRARALSLDPRAFFDASNSYNFFKTLGDTIETGATGNNLRDLRLMLAE